MPLSKRKYVAIIQARIGSTRFPNKVMQTVGGIPIVRRVWLAAMGSSVDQVVVAWPERYPELDQNDVLERFRRIAKETEADVIIRLTADCPLLESHHINEAMNIFHTIGCYQGRFTSLYYSNHLDGCDVQIFSDDILFGNASTHKEHIIADFSTKKLQYGPRSVDTQRDLEYVRAYVNR